MNLRKQNPLTVEVNSVPINNQELRSTFNEFHYWGVPVDAWVRRKVIEANRTIEITPAGPVLIYAKTNGFDVLMEVCLAHPLNRTIHVAELTLKLPFLVHYFRWLPKLMPKLAREHGYFLPHSNCGPFFPPDVLNHFARDIRVLPGFGVDGLLLGSSATQVPEEFVKQRRMPAELTVTTSAGRKVHTWFEFSVIGSCERKPALDKRRRSLLAMRDAQPVG